MTTHEWMVWRELVVGHSLTDYTLRWMLACRYWAGAVGVMDMRTGAITWRVTP